MSFRQGLRLFGASSRLSKQTTRRASILSALNSNPVLVSSNKDIYTNLALEHWLYSSLRFSQHATSHSADKSTHPDSAHSNHPIVLIWTDEPCIVIGRHQNPWVETQLGLVNKLGIKLVRRHSGGGCVYHDENNINISIIGRRESFENRQSNLKFLAQVLNENYGIKCEPNKRHDLVHSGTGLKMSGSAAKLGRHNSYHHFTLLVDTDKEIMQAAIRQKQQDYIETNSSLSTRSSVINLKELSSDVTTDQVIYDLAQAYGKLYKNDQMKQPSRKSKVEANNDDVESMRKIKEELMNPSWVYGMTPKFKLERCVGQAKFRVHIDRGLFKQFEIESDNPSIRAYTDKFAHLVGTSFTYKDAMVNVAKMLQIDVTETSPGQTITGYEQIFATHLLQMIHEANF